MNQWTSDLLEQLRELDHKWRRKVGSMPVPDLREQFLSGFILRGGHAIQPMRSKIATTQVKLPTANVQQSFRPELTNLSLVLN
jgi:hypothetical protein